MTGDPAHAALPDTYSFAGTNFSAAGALSSMVAAATTVKPADLSRDGWNVNGDRRAAVTGQVAFHPLHPGQRQRLGRRG
jgi:hypothetical protein